MEPSDAKMLKVLQRKPQAMSADDWDFLCNEYTFGTVIFGSPEKESDIPVPVRFDYPNHVSFNVVNYDVLKQSIHY